jgi:riboflavin kinase / FMN adenylyltransferase
MRIVYGHQNIDPPPANVVMTVGTFDGVHLGHQAIIREVVRRARETSGTAVVYSFYPPPWRVLGRTTNPFLVTTFQDKAGLIASLGVDLLVTDAFTSDFQRLVAEDFVRDVLVSSFQPQEVLIGYDFRFGQERRGNLELLGRELAREGASARQIDAVRLDGDIVSSTRIRKAVVEGDVAGAARLMGHYHFMAGAIVRDRGRGRAMGFPTANLSPRTELTPGPGVYAVTLETDEGRWSGVANLGYRPTFAEQNFSVEAFLFDFEGDLYGRRARMYFVDRIRGERKFESREALIEQIELDVARVRAMMPFPETPE